MRSKAGFRSDGMTGRPYTGLAEMGRERQHGGVGVAENLVLLWLGVGVLAFFGLRWRANRIAARPELRDTNLPPARARKPG
jgi:hypothetical protein